MRIERDLTERSH